MKRHKGSNPALGYMTVKEQQDHTTLRIQERPSVVVECKCGNKMAHYSHIRNVSGTNNSVFFCSAPDCWEEFLRPRGVIY